MHDVVDDPRDVADELLHLPHHRRDDEQQNAGRDDDDGQRRDGDSPSAFDSPVVEEADDRFKAECEEQRAGDADDDTGEVVDQMKEPVGQSCSEHAEEPDDKRVRVPAVDRDCTHSISLGPTGRSFQAVFDFAKPIAISRLTPMNAPVIAVTPHHPKSCQASGVRFPAADDPM